MKKGYLSLFIISCFILTGIAQSVYYFPASDAFNKSIPSPEQFLGYPIGSHHTRHDKVVEYLKELDRLSDKVSTQIIGHTYEHRPQIVATITSAVNHGKLEEIRQANLARANKAGGDEIPLVITLGYNVHGNEPSSTEAAMLTAYYLVADESAETGQWLSGMVILLDPSYNPDGRDRHAHWANMHKGSPLVKDPMDREHNEVWPGGRTNHYWFDLNRDWFLGIHPESKSRLKLFHDWMPYVMTDHHEMGTNATFYFDPGKYSSNNPIVPPYLYDVVYPKFGEYFSAGMNNIKSLYYTKESFDKLYPGYGSSYVNFYGGAGFLFEQASSRGHAQETNTIPLEFRFTIRNQVTASLATLKASLNEKAMLLKCRRDFYAAALTQAKSNPVKAYVFGDPMDPTRTQAFVNLLLLHHIDVYQLDRDLTVNTKNFITGSSYLVPTEQQNYFMVKSVFEKGITYTDSLFYDASTWSLIHAFDLPYQEIRGQYSKGAIVTQELNTVASSFEKSDYGYLINQQDYAVYQTLYRLQEAEIITKTAFKPFKMNINGQLKSFSYGSLFIPVQQQTKTADEIHSLLQLISKDCKIDIVPVNTGYSQEGIDLGSNFLRTLKKIKALMLVGQGVNGYEAGEVWHLLDQRIKMPITKVEMNQFSRVDLDEYSSIVLVSGIYALDRPIEERLKAWVNSGGTLITFKTASEWAIREGLSREKVMPADTVSSARTNYEVIQNREGAKQIGGSIFEADLDITHPLGFGISDRKISVYKNNKTLLMPSRNPTGTVARYTAKPLIGGYLHPSNESKIANSAALLCSYEGTGRVILFADNPNFRGVWYGTNRLFLNALFFGPIITSPIGGFASSEARE
jgi:hypothetical protein